MLSSLSTSLPRWFFGNLFWTALAVLLLFHFGQAFFVPIINDEAYYRLWADSLQWGYYDHPPMVAWWIAAGELFFGPPFGTRVVGVVSHIATSVVLYYLLREIGADKPLAQRGALAWQFVLIALSDGFLIIPDSPATLFWTTALFLVLRAVRTGDLRWWFAAGLCSGLLCLSKYSGFLLAPGIGLWLLVRHRNIMATPGPYLTCAVVLILFAPNIWWNANSEWVAFSTQFGRVGSSTGSLVSTPDPVIFFLGQLWRFNPVLTILAVVACFQMWRGQGVFSRIDSSILALTSVPLLLTVLVQSTHSKALGHWTLPVLPPLAALAVFGLGGTVSGRRQAVFWFCLIVPASLYLFKSYHSVFSSSKAESRAAANFSILGWPDFAERVRHIATVSGAKWIGMPHYIHVSKLSGLEVMSGLPVVQLIERLRYPPSHPSWRADVSRPGVVLLSREQDYGSIVDPDDLNECFGSVKPNGSVVRRDYGHVVMEYRIYLVSEPRLDILQYGCALPSYMPFLGGARYLRTVPPQAGAVGPDPPDPG